MNDVDDMIIHIILFHNLEYIWFSFFFLFFFFFGGDLD